MLLYANSKILSSSVGCYSRSQGVLGFRNLGRISIVLKSLASSQGFHFLPDLRTVLYTFLRLTLFIVFLT
jgi:hypothetical protein